MGGAATKGRWLLGWIWVAELFEGEYGNIRAEE